MRQTTLTVTLLVAAALLVAVPAVGLAAVPSTAASPQMEADQPAANETAPGEHLSGVVGVGEAELQGDLDQRAFGIQIAEANTQENRAAILADRLGDVDERLTDLEQRRAELAEKRDAGEISDGKYNAEMARIAAEISTAHRLTNRSQQAATQLPDDVLEERGVGPAMIERLGDRASDLRGPEVAERARAIAGGDVGTTPSDRPVDVGPPADRGTERSGNESSARPDDR